MNSASLPSDQSFCSQCGSILILVEEKTEYIDNNPHPITVSIFKCSNFECQEAREKAIAARMKAREEQDKAREARAHARQGTRYKRTKRNN